MRCLTMDMFYVKLDMKSSCKIKMKKQDNFVKEVVSFLKKLLVSRKQRCLPKTNNFNCWFFFMSVCSFFLN